MLPRCMSCAVQRLPLRDSNNPGQAATVSDINEALQQWGAMQQPLQPAPQCFQQQYQQQLLQQPRSRKVLNLVAHDCTRCCSNPL